MVHQVLDEPPRGDRARAPLPELRDGAGKVLLRVRQDEEARVSELLEDLGEYVHVGHLLGDLGARQRLRHHLQGRARVRCDRRAACLLADGSGRGQGRARGACPLMASGATCRSVSPSAALRLFTLIAAAGSASAWFQCSVAYVHSDSIDAASAVSGRVSPNLPNSAATLGASASITAEI